MLSAVQRRIEDGVSDQFQTSIFFGTALYVNSDAAPEQVSERLKPQVAFSRSVLTIV